MGDFSTCDGLSTTSIGLQISQRGLLAAVNANIYIGRRILYLNFKIELESFSFGTWYCWGIYIKLRLFLAITRGSAVVKSNDKLARLPS